MDNRFDSAKAIYADRGIDVEAALKKMDALAISVHCWQGDDVIGFDSGDTELSGGIQTTGNYPGKARTPEELMADFEKAMSLIPGKKKINLHASYAIQNGEKVDRDALEGKHFDAWIEFAKKNNIGIDFNPTFFAHPMVKDNLTLSSPDEEVRQFWIRHGQASRRIASYIGEQLGQEVVNNVWIADGLKDFPGDRMVLRARLKDSLDQIFEEKLPHVIDCVESKVFGIGLESYTVGSSEFYIAYASSKENVYNLLDAGHYHPTESIVDKISSMLLYFDKLPLHVSRPVRWDSDHVVSFNDENREIAQEIVRCDGLEKVKIGLDFFDASINRVAAWVIGTRNMQKSMLYALLQDTEELTRLQDEANYTELLLANEEYKTLPLGDIWAEWCKRNNVPNDGEWFRFVKEYEEEVLLKRV